MDRAYFDSLPEVQNIFGFPLAPGEKAVFAAKLKMFGTEMGEILGNGGSKFTLTNRRMFAANPIGLWTVDLEDINSFVYDDRSVLFIRNIFFSVGLDRRIYFDNGRRSLSGFQFYFGKKDTEALRVLISR